MRSVCLYSQSCFLDGSRTVTAEMPVQLSVCTVTFPPKALGRQLGRLHLYIGTRITDLFSSGAIGVCYWAIVNLEGEGKRLV